jgi:hypothetical protein
MPGCGPVSEIPRCDRYKGRVAGRLATKPQHQPFVKAPRLKGKRNDNQAPLPPFTRDTAIQKVRAEDGWNSRDPEKVALAYSLDSCRRNRSEFVNGRLAIVAFLARKWEKELVPADQRTLDFHR